MNRFTLSRLAVAAVALTAAAAHAETLYTETFEAAPLSNAHYDLGSVVTNTGLEVTAGPVAIFYTQEKGQYLNLYSGAYAANYGQGGVQQGSSSVRSVTTFDLIAGHTYTLDYEYSRGFGTGGNGPFDTSLIVDFGGHTQTYNDVAGFYYGPDWQDGKLTFTQQTTLFGARVSFTAKGPCCYSSMAIDNVSLVGLAPVDPPPTPSPVPEPSTYALMLGGLAVVGRIARRRRA